MVKETVVDEEYIERMDALRKPKDPDAGLFEAGRDNIVIFAEKMLGFELYAWQVEFLTELQNLIEGTTEKRSIAALTSRQIGKSFSLAVAAVWAASYNKAPGTAFNNTAVGIVSASDRQAKEVMREINKVLLHGDAFMKERYERPEFFSSLIDPSEQNNTEIRTFKAGDKTPHPAFLQGARSGCQIMSYPPTGKVLGKSFTLIFVDEAARIREITDDFIKEELMPTAAATGAPFVYTSTPWQPAGHFYRLVDPEGKFSESPAKVFKFTIDALKQDPSDNARKQYEYVQKHLIEPLKRDGDIAAVRKSYYCEFVADDRTFFKPESVEAMFDEDYPMFEEWDGPVDIGIDFGGHKKSRTSVTVSAVGQDGVIRRLYEKLYPNSEDDILIEDLENDIMVRFPDWQRIMPEICLQAAHFIRKMEEKGWNIEPLEPRTHKTKLYGSLRACLNRGEVKSFSDDNLRSEMLALETNNSRSRAIISAPPGYADDSVDSFLYSCFFYLDNESPKFGFVDFNTGDIHGQD